MKLLSFLLFVAVIHEGICLLANPRLIRLTDTGKNETSEDRKTKRQVSEGDFGGVNDQYCTFDVTPCSWYPPNSFVNHNQVSRASIPSPLTSWTLSNGFNAHWIGGPLDDTTGEKRGGYAFHETSSVPGLHAKTAIMESGPLIPTGASGKCLKFWYSVEGLSANMLQVKVRGINNNEETVIWETKDGTRGDWKQAQALYTFTANHSIIVEGVPAKFGDPFNIFRGHIAVDDLGIRSGLECIGLCSFEGGFCDWVNTINDDFDWILGRGTQNPITGPPRDHSSSLGDSLGGAYIYVDSAFPRRPSDVARIESIDFQETDPNNPPCMRFHTYMSGKGVGTLRVIVQDVNSRRETEVWKLEGNQGSRWIMGQLSLSSNSPFKVIFEGTVGQPRLGDIALDDITIISGPCSTLPTAASPPSSGDCTFEEGACGWSNPSVRERVDDLDFIRIRASDQLFPNEDHSLRTEAGFYMTLENPENKLEGDRAWFLSPTMVGRRQIKCISFWYLMFEPLTDDTEPNLGSMSAFLKREDNYGSIVLTPIWTMHNFQGLTWNFAQAPLRAEGEFQVVIEAVWGSAHSKGSIAIDDISIFEGSCPTVPISAVVRAGDCTFTRGSCGWSNVTNDPEFYFSFASPLRRPISIDDHTYGAPAGYIYFDIYKPNNRNRRLLMVSPVIEPSPDIKPMCFTFWFIGFGADPNTTLSIYQRNAQLSPNQIINANDDLLIWSYSTLRNRLGGWQFGQVSLVANQRIQVVIQGSSKNGGFALDDFKVYDDGCAMRPRSLRGIPRN